MKYINKLETGLKFPVKQNGVISWITVKQGQVIDLPNSIQTEALLQGLTIYEETKKVEEQIVEPEISSVGKTIVETKQVKKKKVRH